MLGFLLLLDGKFKVLKLDSVFEIKYYVGNKHFTLKSENGDLELYLNPKAALNGKNFNIWVGFLEAVDFVIPYVYGDVILISKKGFSSDEIGKYEKMLNAYLKLHSK